VFPRFSAYTFYHRSPDELIFAVKPSAWVRFILFLLGKTEYGTTQKKVFVIFFKLSKLVEDYQLLLPSNPLDGDFCGLENIDFLIWSPLKFSQFSGNIFASFFFLAVNLIFYCFQLNLMSGLKSARKYVFFPILGKNF
jgi:hypothetical protein